MKAGKRLVCLIACGASTFTLAAQDLSAITQATATVNDCARVVNDAANVPAPAGHAESAMAAQTNAKVTDPQQKLVIDPVHGQFAAKMQGDAARVADCGPKAQAAVAKAMTTVQSVARVPNLSKEDATALAAAVGEMQKAQDGLRDAVVKLSGDGAKRAYFTTALGPMLGAKP
ncbi:hypothetical protein [Usitatibacter palustris]|uniref:Uncharacterized protein n=1 Tax=Usitatibacter palustris TaxID=2732487 RepID=A0A6M4HAK0_9PROT|nr:hypothetical protein [Usitatibacter palustris]QJR16262.1 hypothetical protein DSM104440_03091 [Usitatibacter palustris]